VPIWGEGKFFQSKVFGFVNWKFIIVNQAEERRKFANICLNSSNWIFRLSDRKLISFSKLYPLLSSSLSLFHFLRFLVSFLQFKVERDQRVAELCIISIFPNNGVLIRGLLFPNWNSKIFVHFSIFSLLLRKIFLFLLYFCTDQHQV
jgi:hypothetical protein